MCFVSTQPQLDPSKWWRATGAVGHTSCDFVKQLTQSNAVQMLGSSTEQEIQMLSFHKLKLWFRLYVYWTPAGIRNGWNSKGIPVKNVVLLLLCVL